jgi:hypothetical protein
MPNTAKTLTSRTDVGAQSDPAAGFAAEVL